MCAIHVGDITDRATFCDLDSSENGLRVSARDLGSNVHLALEGARGRLALEGAGGHAPEREMLRLIFAWNRTTKKFDAKLQTEATAKAQGVPVTKLTCDWASFIEAYRHKFGVKPSVFRLGTYAR